MKARILSAVLSTTVGVCASHAVAATTAAAITVGAHVMDDCVIRVTEDALATTCSAEGTTQVFFSGSSLASDYTTTDATTDAGPDAPSSQTASALPSTYSSTVISPDTEDGAGGSVTILFAP